jgi:hypothetical protein
MQFLQNLCCNKCFKKHLGSETFSLCLLGQLTVTVQASRLQYAYSIIISRHHVNRLDCNVLAATPRVCSGCQARQPRLVDALPVVVTAAASCLISCLNRCRSWASCACCSLASCSLLSNKFANAARWISCVREQQQQVQTACETAYMPSGKACCSPRQILQDDEWQLMGPTAICTKPPISAQSSHQHGLAPNE